MACSQQPDVYMFSFFQGNGEDGLHLAYSHDGYTWTPLKNNESFLTPEVGEDKLMRDPCIIKGPDGKFHMVWTVSWHERGIGYSNSEDLINWSEQKYVPVMEHEPDANNCWAPEVFYDEKQGLYMIYWATTIPGRYPETDDSGDNGLNHRMYYVTTKDFEEFSETKLLYDQGFNVIDAVITTHQDEYIMFLKNETKVPEAEKNIRIARSKNLTEGYGPASDPITINWVEGPTVTKIDDQWVVYFDMYTKHRMGAVASSDLENWKDISDQINFPEGTRHGTVFKVNQKILDNLLNL
ncbi:MAG: glycoside hydrolase family 43 protein [Cyclobacteriaceae bacterium]